MSSAEPLSQEPRVCARLAAAEKTFPNGLRALDPIDLEVRSGEFLTLLGPSGCGKSTLLRMLAGLTAPTRGSVSLNAVSDGAPQLAFVFQEPTLMPWASIARNVRLPLDLAGHGNESAQRLIDEALGLVGLREFSSAYPRELSGGMQMRVSLARALVVQPRLLLMDEPFGALDEITRGRLDLELRDLWHAQRLTVVFVTHSIYEAAFLATRVVVLSPRPGRIAAEVRIDEPHPRDDRYRLSERFAARCRELSQLLARAAGAAS